MKSKDRSWVVVKDEKARKLILDEIDPKHEAKCGLCEIKITPKNLGGFGMFKDGKFHYACKQKICAMIFVWDSLDDGMPENAKVMDLDEVLNSAIVGDYQKPKSAPIMHYQDWKYKRVRCGALLDHSTEDNTDSNTTSNISKVTCKNCLKLIKHDEDKMLKRYNLHRGQKVLYLSPNSGYGVSHQVVTVNAISTYLDEYDILLVDELEGFILPSDILTFSQVCNMLGKPIKDFDIDWNQETLVGGKK